MKYDNENVRRQDRLMEEEAARALLRDGEYGVLSLTDKEGEPYGIPVSYVWDGEESIYVHCAMEGRKIRILKENARVSFCVVGATNVIADKFTTLYQSIVVSGEAKIDLDDEERLKALRMLVGKYSKDYTEKAETYIKGSFHRTNVIRMNMERMSGKRKKFN